MSDGGSNGGSNGGSDGGERQVFGERYELVRHIARGGMARVYLARDLLLDRPVALKVLFPELSVDESFVQRFRREAQAAANLSHPNIVSIYDWGQGEHTYYIVMEYVDGETLSARIRRGPLAPDQAAIVGISTAAALAFAHRRRVIHRDVKPGNVLIDRSGQVKVADFGIARALGTSEDLTQAGAVMGTATYFSPEQAQGHAVDARSDVYSLGVVLYEMVVGRPPFQGDSPVAIAYKHVRETPVPPREISPAVPAAFEAITLKALAKEPEARYDSADELRSDLERFRAGQPVLAAAGAAVAAGAADAAATTMLAATSSAAATRVNRPVDPTTVAPIAATAPLGPPDRRGPVADESPPSRRGWYVAGIVVLLVILAVLAYFLGRDLGLFGSAKQLTIPSVAGDAKATAVTDLKHDGFSDVTTTPVTSASVAKGDVVGTDPKAGTRLASDDHLVVDVSDGPAQVAVPSVSGDTEAQAKSALEAKGFKVTATATPSSTVTKGDAIRTDPASGKLEAKGTTIQLIYSAGPAEVAIRSVTGDTPVVATTTLDGEGLTVSSTTGSQASNTVAAGDVVGTNPAAGTTVAPGTTVTIILSTGPSKVSVPDVLGDSRSAAQAALEAKGFTVSFTTVTVTSAGENGKVQNTDPPAGTSEQAGTNVVVAIGSYTAPATTTTTTPPPTTTTNTAVTTTG